MTAIVAHDPEHAAVEWLAERGHGARARIIFHATGSGVAALRLAAMLRGDPAPDERPSTVDDPTPPPRPTAAPAPLAPPPVPPAEAAHLRSAEGCIHRDPGVGCCPVTRCELAGRKVTILDCLRCIIDRDLDVHSAFIDVDPWG